MIIKEIIRIKEYEEDARILYLTIALILFHAGSADSQMAEHWVKL